MSIKDWWEKIKIHESAIFAGGGIILFATLGFGLGRLSKIEEAKVPVKVEWLGGSSPAGLPAQVGERPERPTVENPTIQAKDELALPAAAATGNYVASKNGAKYYLPGCSGVQRIKEENKVWFATKEAAEKAGYGPASNCPGL